MDLPGTDSRPASVREAVRLVYPRPVWWTTQLRSPRGRLLLLAGVVAWVGLLILMAQLISWSTVILCSLIGLVVGLLERRKRTVVTSQEVSLRGIFRTRTFPIGQLERFVARPTGGTPICVVSTDGQRYRLPKVKASALKEIGALTGLPIQDRTE